MKNFLGSAYVKTKSFLGQAYKHAPNIHRHASLGLKSVAPSDHSYTIAVIGLDKYQI